MSASLTEGFLQTTICLASVLLTVCDIIDRIRHKDSHCVRWSLLLEVILSGSSFFALLGVLANGLDYLYGESPDVLWFVIMMSAITVIGFKTYRSTGETGTFAFIVLTQVIALIIVGIHTLISRGMKKVKGREGRENGK